MLVCPMCQLGHGHIVQKPPKPTELHLPKWDPKTVLATADVGFRGSRGPGLQPLGPAAAAAAPQRRGGGGLRAAGRGHAEDGLGGISVGAGRKGSVFVGGRLGTGFSGPVKFVGILMAT